MRDRGRGGERRASLAVGDEDSMRGVVLEDDGCVERNVEPLGGAVFGE